MRRHGLEDLGGSCVVFNTLRPDCKQWAADSIALRIPLGRLVSRCLVDDFAPKRPRDRFLTLEWSRNCARGVPKWTSWGTKINPWVSPGAPGAVRGTPCDLSWNLMPCWLPCWLHFGFRIVFVGAFWTHLQDRQQQQHRSGSAG